MHTLLTRILEICQIDQLFGHMAAVDFREPRPLNTILCCKKSHWFCIVLCQQADHWQPLRNDPYNGFRQVWNTLFCRKSKVSKLFWKIISKTYFNAIKRPQKHVQKPGYWDKNVFYLKGLNFFLKSTEKLNSYNAVLFKKIASEKLTWLYFIS